MLQKCVSHIIKEDNLIIVFNTENDVPIGSYYMYDIEQADGGELSLINTGDDKENLEKYYNNVRKHKGIKQKIVRKGMKLWQE